MRTRTTFVGALAIRAIPIGAVLLIAVAANTVSAQQREATDALEAQRQIRRAQGSGELPGAERQQIEDQAMRRFVEGDVTGALELWNRIGEPSVSRWHVEGLLRTREALVREYLGIDEGDLLTPDQFLRMRRRLEELPITTRTSVRFDPSRDGTTSITPIVFERDPRPTGPLGWGPTVGRAVVTEEVQVAFNNPLGWGDAWVPAFRYDRDRPRFSLAFAVPAPGALPGVLHADLLIERQSYRYDALGPEVVEETRRRGGVTLSDWATGWLRWEAGGAVDAFRDLTYLSAHAGARFRNPSDRLMLQAEIARWRAPDPAASFRTAQVVGAYRTTLDRERPGATLAAGVMHADPHAPLALWYGAGTSVTRGALLRARRLHPEGIVGGDVFGRQLVFGTSEYGYPMLTGYSTVTLAAFVDAACAWDRPGGVGPASWQVDVGGGIRVPITRSGDQGRIDVGYGLRDHGVRVSLGYVVPWGAW